MQKEVLLAIFIGFLIGLIITFGIWKANQAIKSTLPEAPKTSQEETPTPEINLPVLAVVSPVNNFLSKESTLLVKGSYTPDSQIVIIAEKGEKTLIADEEGNFETEITLIAGENQIQIFAFTKEGNEAKQVFTVVYSTAEI